MTDRSPKSVRIIKKIMRCDDATNMHRRERYRNYGRKYLKENFIRKISSQTEKTQYNLQ